MRCAHLLCVLLFFLPAGGQVFRTGAAVKPPSGSPMRPMTPGEYRKFADVAKSMPIFRAIRELPPNLSADYRLGFDFVYDSANHGWILDRDSQGYKLFLDFKGDGDLSNAEPLRFHDVDGVPRIDIPMKDGAATWIARMELVPDQAGPSVRFNLSSVRSGRIMLRKSEVSFRLSGESGRFDQVGDYVLFDRHGDGKYESFTPSDRWVNLAGKTFEFRVDPHGDTLTLTESSSRPDRPTLALGSPIPDVAMTDLDGKTHAFRHNAADFTLIEFWDTHCGPCRQEMPALKALYDKVPRFHFQIIGVSSDDSEADLKTYLAESSIAWAEIREPFEGRVHRLLRIAGDPTYFLLAKNGEILDSWVGSGATIAKLEAKLK